jgi:DHA1 family bicyclomycin/chloramphenicol resistance-like MFS transporter
MLSARSVRHPGLLAALLAGLAMLGPFSIDTYLPSFPFIERDLGITVLEAQQTLSAYLFTFAFMTLFHGTLSDSFGRRPVILVSLALFALASMACAVSQSLNQLLLFRALQGLSAGAGMVVGRAIIRDSFEGHAAQRLMSWVTMIFGLAPALAPVIGGWLQGAFGWHAVFVFLALYAALLLASCHALLPETHPADARQPFRLKPLAANYLRLGRSAPLLLLCSAVALNFCGFFLYIVSAPAFVYGILHLDETQFAWLFVPGIAGVMLGAFLSGRMAGRLTPRRTIAIGYAVMAFAATWNVAYSAWGVPGVPWSVLPVMAYTTGMSLAMPSITLLALELFPQNRGMTASLQGFEQSLFTGILAGVVSPLVSHSAITLAIGMAVPLAAGWCCWMLYLHRCAGVRRHA